MVQTPSLGPADRVTATRAALTAVVGVLVARALLTGGPQPRSAIVVLASVALVLDAVDGQVARRTGTVTERGARFDLETDAALVLVLAVALVPVVGWWVLLSGLARYLLLAAQWAWPWLRGPVPARRWRKAVAAVQGVVLVVAVADVLPRPATVALLVIALALLAISFGTEVLERGARRTDAVSAGALLLVWVALDVPSRTTELTPWALLRVPVEALVLVVLVLLLPARPARVLAWAAGLLAVVLVVQRVLDLGFRLVLHRPFSVLSDWGYLVSGVGVLGDSVGRARAVGLLVLGGVGALAVAVLLPAAVVRVCRLARTHRARSARAVGVLVVGGAALGLVSATTSVRAVEAVGQVRFELRDRVVFARAIADDGTGAAPTLDGLRGHDVLVVFVESYGRVAVEGTSYSHGIGRALDRGTRTLRRAGYRTRSAFLTSPTFGAGSWLAHATLQSGLRVDTQGRYDQLLASRRLTLTGAFGAAGWRTVLDLPADSGAWPQGQAFYRPDRMYDAHDVGYRGPAFGYAPVPDQYTLDWFGRHELAPGPRRPVMAEIDLVSSHHPWAPLPHLVPWDTLGDGSVLDPQPAQGESATQVLGDPRKVRAAYAQSVVYSWGALVGFLQRMARTDPSLVVLALGDHQPHSYVTGPDPGRDVPVTLLTRDRSVVRRVAGWQWQPGLRPGPDAPVWGMEDVRDRFLSTFDTRVDPVNRPAARSVSRVEDRRQR